MSSSPDLLWNKFHKNLLALQPFAYLGIFNSQKLHVLAMGLKTDELIGDDG